MRSVHLGYASQTRTSTRRSQFRTLPASPGWLVGLATPQLNAVSGPSSVPGERSVSGPGSSSHSAGSRSVPRERAQRSADARRGTEVAGHRGCAAGRRCARNLEITPLRPGEARRGARTDLVLRCPPPSDHSVVGGRFGDHVRRAPTRPQVLPAPTRQGPSAQPQTQASGRRAPFHRVPGPPEKRTAP